MYGMYDHGWVWGGNGGMFVGGILMALIWLVPLLAVIALFKYLFGARRGSEPSPQPPSSALDILKNAYARGEIGRDEYLQKRDDILEK